ncbi:MAG: hypothetical protein LCH31_03635 [Actinobacteria bacterium]|nr:hypothetical protein [Actinomycetota bacterium]
MIDAVVTGRSLPALQTALDLAEVGLKVVVLGGGTAEASKPWAERDPDGVIRAFAKRIASAVDQAPAEEAVAARLVELPVSSPMLLQGAQWLPQAEPNVLGVPAVPLAAKTSAALGSGGAFRAYLDRVTPLLTVGKTRMLGALVQKRMGAKVRERLVDPQVFERFGATSAEVEAAVAAPGLNEALSRAGSLSTAVFAYADRNVARETRVTPVRAAEDFVAAALRTLEHYGVELRSEQAVSATVEDDAWRILLEGGESVTARALIADAGESALASEAIAPHVTSVMPNEARLYASMFIERPSWLAAGASAIAQVEDWAVVVESSLGEKGLDKLASTDLSSDAAPRGCAVHLRSGVSGVAEHMAAVEALQPDDSQHVAQVLSVLGLALRRDAVSGDTIVRAAPYRTIAQRHEAAEALAALEVSNSTLSVVGRAVHGDDQAEALAAAHVSAVQLRRRLLGLTD